MIRATTPKHVFVFDTDPSGFKTILITYKQGDRIVLEKHKEDLIFDPHEDGSDEYTAWFRMTQEETKSFVLSNGPRVLVQVRALTYDEEALASDKISVLVKDVLNDEVLV